MEISRKKIMGYNFIDGILVPQRIKKRDIALFFESQPSKFFQEIKRNTAFCEKLKQNIAKSNIFSCVTFINAPECALILEFYGNVYADDIQKNLISIQNTIKKNNETYSKKWKKVKRALKRKNT